jgi:hypothetical protein
LNKNSILNILRENKYKICNDFGVVKIGLFGSYARDEQTDLSDIDIAVEIESQNKFRSFFGLKYYLEKKLHGKIDLGIESALKPVAREVVLKEITYV